MLAAGVVALAAAIAVGTAFGSGKAPTAQKAGYKAAIVSDVATFNDNGFNKNQLTTSRTSSMLSPSRKPAAMMSLFPSATACWKFGW